MSCQLTPEQIEHIRQASASMAIENMPVSEDSYRDAIDYLSGRKAEQEILDGIAKRAHHLTCDEQPRPLKQGVLATTSKTWKIC